MSAIGLLFPTPLKPRDRIRVVAPSSPFDRTLVLRGMAWLGERYRVEFDPGLFDRTGFLAGSDQRRVAELNAALADPGVAAVVAARGGYGLSRIAHRLHFRALLRHPKWIVGFSDITALHLEAQRVGVASYHAHNVAGLGRGDAIARNDWLQALEHPAEQRFDGLETWLRGHAKGVIVGGNLALIHGAAAAGRLSLPRGAILFLEDVSESSYRIDRMLSDLLASRSLDRVAGVVLGEFHGCDAGRHGVPTNSVLLERLSDLGVPLAAGLPVGHGLHNRALLLGGFAELDASAGRLTVSAENATAPASA